MRIFEDQRESIMQRLDPRVRLLGVLGFALLVVTLERWPALATAAAGAIVALFLARMARWTTLVRLGEVNLFVLFLFVFVPLSTPGVALVRIGAFEWTREGALLAARIGLRANTLILACSALLVTMEPVRLGYAMTKIGVPAKFAHIFLFMVRYLETLHVEYHRLRNAMRLRGFVPRCNAHSLRSLGYLVGMLLVRSMDRADRILAAMKCRGFHGRFHVLQEARLQYRDLAFAAVLTAFAASIGWLEWGAG